jgi:5'-phosphate synthase pdxT subunit
MIVGILALQGAFERHVKAIESLGAKAKLVKSPKDLEDLDGLIIPGGESTVMSFFLKENNFQEAIKNFAKDRPVFGTCAGLILMAKNANCPSIASLDLLDIEVNRNAYGRQIESFSKEIPIKFIKDPFLAVFIRAPQITKLLSDKVEVLASIDSIPILVKQGKNLGASFHPELTNNLSIHRYFLDSL